MRVIPAKKYKNANNEKIRKSSKLFSFPSGNCGFSSNSSISLNFICKGEKSITLNISSLNLKVIKI